MIMTNTNNPRNVILFIVFLAVFIFLMDMLANAATIVPQSSMDALEVAQIQDCEIVQVPNDDNSTVQLYVGDKSGNQRRVVDNSAIRGYRSVELTKNNYAVVASSEFTYSPTTDTWVFQTTQGSGVVAHFTVNFDRPYRFLTKSIGYTDEDLNIELITVAAGFRIERVESATSISLTCYLPAKQGHTGRLTINSLRFDVAPIGEDAPVNDLTSNSVEIKDMLGNYNMNMLRYELIHHHDGNRGSDWSKYPATNAIKLAGNRMSFDAWSRYRLGMRDDAVHFDAANKQVFTVYSDGGTPGPGYRPIDISSIACTTNGVDIAFTHDISDFDPDKLIVEYKAKFTDEFEAIFNPTHWTYLSNTSIRVKASALTSTHGLFKLSYDGSDAVAYIAFDVPARFNDALIIKGDDGYHYQLHINGGTISATRVD